jgi:hypothetical protein
MLESRIWMLLALGCALGCGTSSDVVPEGSEAGNPARRSRENLAPVIDGVRFVPTEPVAGDVVRAVAGARDPDGDRLELRYEWAIDGRRLFEEGPEIQLQEVGRGALLEVTVTGDDGLAASEPFQAATRVRNRRPRLLEVRTEPWDAVPRGTPVILSARGTDPDGDVVDYRYRWEVNGGPIDAYEASLPTGELNPGDVVQARVVATDGRSNSDPIDSARVRVINAHPQILSTPGGVASDGSFRYAVEARDPDGAAKLHFGLRSAPKGMRIDPMSGVIVWLPKPSQSGRHGVEVEVSDSEGATTIQHFELEVASAANPS